MNKKKRGAMGCCDTENHSAMHSLRPYEPSLAILLTFTFDISHFTFLRTACVLASGY